MHADVTGDEGGVVVQPDAERKAGWPPTTAPSLPLRLELELQMTVGMGQQVTLPALDEPPVLLLVSLRWCRWWGGGWW